MSESVKELGLNDFSRKIIYRDIDEFEKELNRQRVIVGDRLKESRGAFVRRGVVWAVLCFILIMLFFNRGMIYF